MSAPLPEMNNPNTAQTEQDAAVAQALIASEQANLRTGFAVLFGFFLLVAVGAFLFSLFILHHANIFSIPVGIAILLILFSLGRRIFRFSRSMRGVQQNWNAGRLGSGESAVAAAATLRQAATPTDD